MVFEELETTWIMKMLDENIYNISTEILPPHLDVS